MSARSRIAGRQTLSGPPGGAYRPGGPDSISLASKRRSRASYPAPPGLLYCPSLFPSPSKGRSAILLDKLNPEQREAACAIEGPVLIFAGAGSGKTRTLTHRIAHMIQECGVRPSQILAVTFTNKAANELKERIRLLVGDDAERLWAGTFHWFCVRLLRAEGKAIGVKPDFTIYDESDSLTTVKHALSALNIDSEQTKPPAVLNEISQAKNQLLTVSEYRVHRNNPLEQATRQVYRVYQDQLRQNNALDFDDLLMLAVQLLDQHPDVRARYQDRFHYLLVDEYQDINFAQFRLLQLLAGERSNLCVVGDDDQSIYGWRGADVGLILAFREHFPQAQIFRLERNYRSTQKILDCANAVISQNALRTPKKLWTENAPGEDIVLYAAVNEEEEAEWVVDTLQRVVVCGDGAYGDFAVLYRINAMSRVFEEALMAANVPYEVVGGMRFFDRAELKDMVAYLQVLHNPSNSLALRRIINTPTRGIGDSALSILDRLAMTQEISLFEAARLALQDESLPARTTHAFRAFVELIDGLVRLAAEVDLPTLAREMIRRTGYLERLKASAKADDARRAENVEELVSVAARFVARRGEGTGLLEFLEYLALSADIDKAEALGEKVSLLTLHSAKGLEFPTIFLAGCEEEVLPHYRSMNDPAEIAEERRLCYVGITRAQRRLYLSHCSRRTVFGDTREMKPSRFLADLPEELVQRSGRPAPPALIQTPGLAAEMAMTGRRLDLTEVLSRAKSRPAGEGKPARAGARTKRKTEPHSAGEYSVGDKVRHAQFGEGMVVSIKQDGQGDTLVVAFPGAGLKKLLVEYAGLEKV